LGDIVRERESKCNFPYLKLFKILLRKLKIQP